MKKPNIKKMHTSNPVWRNTIDIFILILTAFMEAAAMNWFLIPTHTFTVGFNGISQMLTLATKVLFGINVSPGVFILISSLIIGVIGWKMVGSRFTILSTINSVLISIMVIFIPEMNLADNTLLAALFAGVLVGAGVGLSMRFGFSTGGMDIIAMIFQKKTGKTVGFITNIINGVIVLIAGFFIGWKTAFYTMISIYATAQAIDAIFTNDRKLTALIVTQKGDAVVKALHKDLIRGITVLPSYGAYTKKDSTTLMMVINRVELTEMQEIVLDNDPNAFINILSTIELKGLYLDANSQKTIKSQTQNEVI